MCRWWMTLGFILIIDNTYIQHCWTKHLKEDHNLSSWLIEVLQTYFNATLKFTTKVCPPAGSKITYSLFNHNELIRSRPTQEQSNRWSCTHFFGPNKHHSNNVQCFVVVGDNIIFLFSLFLTEYFPWIGNNYYSISWVLGLEILKYK